MEAPGASINGEAVGIRTNYGQMHQGSWEHGVNVGAPSKWMSVLHVRIMAIGRLL
jgi:hypothetical protein